VRTRARAFGLPAWWADADAGRRAGSVHIKLSEEDMKALEEPYAARSIMGHI
jgi:hypothetical protein